MLLRGYDNGRILLEGFEAELAEGEATVHAGAYTFCQNRRDSHLCSTCGCLE